MTSLTQMSTTDLVTLVVGVRAATQIAKLPRLAELRVARVSELTASYGLTTLAARKAIALAELARRLMGEELRTGERIRSSRDVYRHARTVGLTDLQVEQFHALLLDGKHRLIQAVLVSQGTLTSSPVHPREVFAPAVRSRAAGIVLCHNHPSGDPTPSADDLEITRRLREVGDLVGIRVLDHVIVGQQSHVSLADRGVL